MAFVAASGDHERRCHARSNRTGKQCRRWGVRGTEPPVCRSHGGAAPQVKAAAERRLAEREVREIALQLDVDPQDFSTDPLTWLNDLIRRGAAMVERFGRLAESCQDGQSLVYTAKSGVRQIRPEFAAFRAERESFGRHLELLLKAEVTLAQITRAGHREEIIDQVAMALGVAVTSVLLRHPELDTVALHDEIMEEFRRTAKAWTADHPQPEHPRALAAG
jgi:hypothetical protein